MKAALAQAQALIESGFAEQGAGRLDAARQAYEQALKLIPEHPTALQLLGLLARQGGHWQSAHDLMRRSLAVHPGQPHVWNNLANTLEDMGQSDAALECLSQALKLQPGYAEAHYNRARLLFAAGRQAAARDAAEKSIEHGGPTPPARYWQLLAQVVDGLDGPLAALGILTQGTDSATTTAELIHDEAVLLQRLGRHEQALIRHERALAMGLKAVDAHYNRGNTLQSLGRMAEAEGAYFCALNEAPHHELTHFDLARLRWRQGRQDWMDVLTEAIVSAPNTVGLERTAALFALKAQLWWRAEDLNQARAAFQAAWELDPRAQYRDGMARCAVRMGTAREGLALHQEAIRLEPQDATLQASYASSLIVAGRLDQARQPVAKALALEPLDQYAWALMTLVMRKCDPDKASALLSPELMRVVDLPAPPGHRDMFAFNQALAAELVAQHHDRQAPVDQTLRGGTQTLGTLFDQNLPLVSALRTMISPAIDAFVQQLGRDATHPLLGRNTGQWHYTDSWSSRLHSRGRHTNHVHPHGWISAVYYVQVPDVCADSDSKQGWLRFGEPDLDMAHSFGPTAAVQPKPGRLVLFPSYWWHGTAPFESAESRMTIAFDVLPTKVRGNPRCMDVTPT